MDIGHFVFGAPYGVNDLLPGIALISLTALANGMFSIPLRYRRRYAVENMWVLAFPLGYLLIPQLLAQWLAPGWAQAIRSAPQGLVAVAVLMGAGWGVASIFFSQAIPRVGVSLGYAVIMGLTMAVGSIIPLSRKSNVPAAVWIVSLAGIAMALLGVAISGRAGLLRERHQGAATCPSGALASPPRGKTLLVGLVLCVVAGLLSAFNNIGFDYAQPLAGLAGPGVHPVLASFIPWLPLYWGGSAAVIVASVVQMTYHRTWNRYRGQGAARDFRLALLMGLILALTQIPYGMGVTYLGKLGTSAGFAVSMILSLVVANLAGVIMGEWRGAGKHSVRTLLAGLACLIAATGLLTWASQLNVQ